MFVAKSHATLRAHPSCCKVPPHVNFPRILARKNYAHEVHTFRQFPAKDPFFPDFLFTGQVPLENLTACFDPNSPFSRGVDFLGQES